MKTAKEIHKYMLEKDKTLRSDTDFKRNIYLKTICESEFRINSAQFEEVDDYLIVFTEHFGCFHVHKDEVEIWGYLD